MVYLGAMLINAVPQRLGSLVPNSAKLPGGCRALAGFAGEVLGQDVHEVPIGGAESSTVDGIAHREALVADRASQLLALEAPEGPVLTIGGDCGVEHVPLGVARFRHGDGLGVLWLDAHPDLNTAETSPSGAFHGMVLRSALGDGDAEFAASPALTPGRAVLAGTRSFDEGERAAVDDGLAVLAGSADPETVLAALAATGADRLYLHLDLDVLDPAEFAAVNYPEDGGITVTALTRLLAALGDIPVIGAGITECTAADRGEVAALGPVLAEIGRLLDGAASGPPG
ncbi:arginase family protein [Amycolatopsis minnesotensis]|uniref:Arginase family protein n=2 Tax=Amycolatopsis minnesotensis TaxID=337894 RepID=A0ABN2SBR3_9PSEU